MTNWQKVAQDRLKLLRVQEQLLAAERTRVARAIKDAMEFNIHSRCFASLSAPGTVALIDGVVESALYNLGLAEDKP